MPTESRIRTLADEAAAAGDLEQTALCQLAVDGAVSDLTLDLLRDDERARVEKHTKQSAWDECARAITSTD